MSDEDHASELARLVADVDRKMSGDANTEVLAPRLRDRAGHQASDVARDVDITQDLGTRAAVQHRSVHAETTELSATLPPRAHDAATQRLTTQGPTDNSRHGQAVTEPLPVQLTGDHTSDTTRPARIGTRWYRVRRRITQAMALLVVAGLGYFAVTLVQVWSTGRADDRDAVDAIVVMGAAQYDGTPSPQLQARLDHVLALWPDEIAPLVVVTGGNLPGDRFTEAEASAAYLIERGVPASAVLREDQGSNTYESLASVEAMLDERGVQSVVIVTDPYHALRSKLIAEEVGLDASTSATPTSVVSGGQSLRRHVEEAGGVAVGRLIGFRRLADLVS